MGESRHEPAVIDRFEGEYAVILVGEMQRPYDIPRHRLPPAAREGDWLRIERIDNQIITVQLDPEATAAARQRILSKLERLRRGEHLTDA